MRRSGGREFDKMIHHYEPWIDGKRHKVGIKMCLENEKAPTFYTEHFKDDNKKVVKNSFKKIEELYNWIEEQLATLPDVAWVSKILIEVRGSSRGSITGYSQYEGFSLVNSEVSISAVALEIGTGSDGKTWSRNPGKPTSISKFDKNIGYGLENRYFSSKDDQKPYSRALIDDTIENRKMLVQFAVRFDELRAQFYRAFSPEYVEKFLSAAAGTLLLSGLKEE